MLLFRYKIQIGVQNVYKWFTLNYQTFEVNPTSHTCHKTNTKGHLMPIMTIHFHHNVIV